MQQSSAVTVSLLHRKKLGKRKTCHKVLSFKCLCCTGITEEKKNVPQHPLDLVLLLHHKKLFYRKTYPRMINTGRRHHEKTKRIIQTCPSGAKYDRKAPRRKIKKYPSMPLRSKIQEEGTTKK